MKLFHISSEDLHNKILKPKIPQNILTKLGIENNTIPRVSFAPTISHALLAIGFNRIKEGSKILNVFEPKNYNNLKIINDEELDKKGYVPDANKTKEHWILNDVKIIYVGKINIIKPTNKSIIIKWGPKKDQQLKNYFWEYKVIDGELE